VTVHFKISLLELCLSLLFLLSWWERWAAYLKKLPLAELDIDKQACLTKDYLNGKLRNIR